MATIKGIVDIQKTNYKSLGQVNAGSDLVLELEVAGIDAFVNPNSELLAIKEDGNRVRQITEFQYIGNKIIITADEQLVTCEGKVACQLKISDAENNYTGMFYFICGKSLDIDIIKSIDNVKVLKDLDEYVLTAFANLQEFEQRILAGEATIRKLNEDITAAENIRENAEANRAITFSNLVKDMNTAIATAVSTDATLNDNELDRINNFNTLKTELERIREDLNLLNNSVSLEEQKRVQAEIDRANASISAINKLNTTNANVATAEATRVQEWNNIKIENTDLKEALTTINNTANSNEEVRKTNEVGRVAAETKRESDFQEIKTGIGILESALVKKVDDKLVETQTDNTQFKAEMDTQIKDIANNVNNFDTSMRTSYYKDENGKDIVLESADVRAKFEVDKLQQQINDSNYLQYEGTNIKAENTNYGYCKDSVLGGRLLHNLCSIKTCKSGVDTTTYVDVNIKYTLNSNTYYTLFYEVTKENKGCSQVGDSFDRLTPILRCKDGTTKYQGFEGFNTTKGLKRWLFNVSSEVVEISFWFNKLIEVGEVDNIILLEGDIPLSEYPPHFEGITSVGESENNKLEVKTTGKNLYTSNSLDRLFITNSSAGAVFKLDSSTIRITTKTPIKINKDAQYITTKFENKYQFFMCGVANNIVTLGSGWTDYSTLKTYKGDVVYVSFRKSDNSVITDLEFEEIKQIKLLLEEGAIVNTYQPYVESIAQVTSPIPLRSLPNGVQDLWYLEKGIIEQKVEKTIIDGSGGFGGFNTAGGTSRIYTSIENKKEGFTNVLASNLKTEPTYANKAYGISGTPNNNAIWISIPQVEDSGKMLDWMRSNPITVYYELATPIIHKVSPQKLLAFDETTHASCTNSLPGNFKSKFPSNVQAVVMSLRSENKALNNELENTKVELDNSIQALEAVDVDLVSTSWDMDFRVCEIEWFLEDTIPNPAMAMVRLNLSNNNTKGGINNMALSRYEQAKIMILGGSYNKETLSKQLKTHLSKGNVTQEEYDELIALMEARDMVEEK